LIPERPNEFWKAHWQNVRAPTASDIMDLVEEVKIMEEDIKISKENRRKRQEAGPPMPMHGAGLRPAARRQRERDLGLRSQKPKKGTKRRKRNR